MAIGELIYGVDTLNQGRIKINNFYSGQTIIWSSSTGTYSVIRNNVAENLNNAALGFNSFAAGASNTASNNFSIAFWGTGNTSSGYFSSVLVGKNNTASGNFTTILAGTNNTTNSTAVYSVIIGGSGNTISNGGSYATILNGRQNSASGSDSLVSGIKNTATTTNSAIISGQQNVASGIRSFMGAGYLNSAATSTNIAILGGTRNVISGASAAYSVVIGGVQNNATGPSSVVSGGYRNSARDNRSFVGAGRQNSTASGAISSAILGGSGNSISTTYATIGGGQTNRIQSNGNYGFIGGGKNNLISSTYGVGSSGIVGGSGNTINSYGTFSFIGGGQGNRSANNRGAIVGGSTNYIGGSNAGILSGYRNRAVGSSSGVIAGKGCYAANAYAAAMGGGAQTRASFSLVIGNQNTTTPNVANNTISLSGSVGYVVAEGGFQTATADYAEYFEWEDGNPSKEDRRGYFVSLVDDKIKIANDDVLGIISSAPGFIGDTAEHRWSGMYIKDDWNNTVFETYTKYDWLSEDKEINYIVFKDKEGNLYKEYPHASFPKGLIFEGVVPENAKVEQIMVPKMNPDYNPSSEAYISRANRPEWSPVGLLGKLHVRTAEPITSKSIDVNKKGLAINGTKYRVLNTIRPHTESQYGIVKVFFK